MKKKIYEEQEMDAASTAGSITISDPDLAAKMAGETAKIAQADERIRKLNLKIGLIVKQKAGIIKNVVNIQKANAKKISDEAKKQNDVNKEAQDQQDQQTVEVPVANPSQPTSESLLVTNRTNKERIEILEDMIVVMNLNEIDDPQLSNEIVETIKYFESMETLYGLSPEEKEDERFEDEEQIEMDWREETPEEVDSENMSGWNVEKIEPETEEERKKKETKKQKKDDKKWDKHDKLDDEIDDLQQEKVDLQNEIYDALSPFQSPDFEGVEGEIENFWGEIGFEAMEILNSGAYSDEDEGEEFERGEDPRKTLGLSKDKGKIAALKAAGVERPEEVLGNYYYYFPEFDPSLVEKRKDADKKVEEIQEKIQKVEDKIEKKIQKQDKIFDVANAISKENFYNLSEAYVEVEGQEKKTREDYINEDYLFYIKVFDNDDWFIGKIFKVSPDGDWYGISKAGNTDTFNKISYPTEYNEMDIVEFLRDNYDSVEIIDRHEYDDYVEEKPGDKSIDEEGGVTGMHI